MNRPANDMHTNGAQSPDTTRILLVNHVSRISGAEKGLLNTVSALLHAGYAPMVILPRPGTLSSSLKRLGITVGYINIPRFKKTWNPARLTVYAFQWVAGIRALTNFIRNHDIRIVHANSSTSQLFAGPATRITGIPCIWHCRDLASPGPAGILMSKTASRIVAVSRAVELHLRSYSRDHDRICIIPNCVNLAEMPEINGIPETRAELGALPETFLAGFAGQLVPWKKPDVFLRVIPSVLKINPNIRFALAGDDMFNDNPGYVRDLRKTACKPEIQNSVVFAGYRQDIEHFLSAIDVLVHTAEKEPFGRILIEAMALGKPVIAVNKNGPSEIIENGVNGILVEPDDHNGFAENICRLAEDRKLAHRLGSRAREHVRQNFNFPLFESRIRRLYEDLRGTGNKREEA